MPEFSLLRRRGLRRPDYAAPFQFIASQHMSRDTPLMSAVAGTVSSGRRQGEAGEDGAESQEGLHSSALG